MPPRRKRPAHTPLKKGRIPANASPLEVVIETVGGRGDGVGTASVKVGYDMRERLLFVPFTLPGEWVRVQPVADRGEGVAADPLELLTTAEERVDPRCPHFMACGGCALQHWRDDAYRDWKVAQIRQHLARVGIVDPPMAPLVAADPETRRRADFAVRRLSNRTVLGFHERGGGRIEPVDVCPVLAPPIQALLHALNDRMHAALKTGEAADVIVNQLDTGLDVLAVLPREPDLAEREAWAAFAASEGLARLSMRMARDSDPTPEPLAVRRPATIRFGAADVAPPPGSFLQATASGEAAIRNTVLEAAGTSGRRIDLFAGVGTLSLPLVEHGPVHAVDGDGAALAALRKGADGAGIGSRLTTEQRDLFSLPLSVQELFGVDVAVFDPPRAGAKAQAAALAESTVPTVVAVSCNPATFARDAASLIAGGYRLEKVAPIDQFLWSPHIELAAVFRR